MAVSRVDVSYKPLNVTIYVVTKLNVRGARSLLFSYWLLVVWTII